MGTGSPARVTCQIGKAASRRVTGPASVASTVQAGAGGTGGRSRVGLRSAKGARAVTPRVSNPWGRYSGGSIICRSQRATWWGRDSPSAIRSTDWTATAPEAAAQTQSARAVSTRRGGRARWR